jgi:hypothetical protein
VLGAITDLIIGGTRIRRNGLTSQKRIKMKTLPTRQQTKQTQQVLLKAAKIKDAIAAGR